MSAYGIAVNIAAWTHSAPGDYGPNYNDSILYESPEEAFANVARVITGFKDGGWGLWVDQSKIHFADSPDFTFLKNAPKDTPMEDLRVHVCSVDVDLDDDIEICIQRFVFGTQRKPAR